MSTDPCGGDVKGGSGCVCDPPFAARRGRIIGDDAARFWSKVEKTEGCWLWRGTMNNGRTPVFYTLVDGIRHNRAAYRWLYEQTIGPIPDQLELVAACGTPECVRLSQGHRVLMSEAELVQLVWDRHPRTHCVHGHEFTPESTSVRPSDGARICLTCRRQRHAAARRIKRR